MRFRDQLRNYLAEDENFPHELLDKLPGGFQELNGVAIFKLAPDVIPYQELIANAIPKLNHRIKAVWVRTGEIEGKFRQPKGLYHVWGDSSSETIVSENNVRYKFDFTRVMFAKGNIHERGLLPKKIQSGEIIIDMFAGIGYFSLGIAKSKKPKKVYSIEWNPESFHFLQENIKLNHVEHIIQPIFGDCKIEIKKLVEQGILADRIIMGLLPAPVDAISSALKAVKPEGTIIVYEGIEQKESTQLFDEFTKISQENGFNTELLERRLVKNYKPFEYHVVLEIKVTFK